MYDVIIVGGGIAGSYIASKIKSKHDVLLLERNKNIVPKDSGIVSSNFFNFFGKDIRKLVKCDVSKMDCVSPSGKTFTLGSDDGQPFAHILKREKFAQYLRKSAKGAEVIHGNARNIQHHKDHVTVSTGEGTFEGRMIIGCDGANSVVRRSMGIEDPRLALGIMVKTEQKLEGGIAVHFNKYYSPDFFSWIIPQSNEYGMMTAIRPREYFSYFAKQQYLPGGKMYAYMIPFTYTRSFGNRALLVGDACGQNKPLTGGGIMFSLTGARHAASVVNDALEADRLDPHFLGFYEKYWRKDLAWEIEKQYFMRMVYRHLSNKEVDELFDKFGPGFASLTEFDYDKLGKTWGHFGKLKFAKFIITKLPRILKG